MKSWHTSSLALTGIMIGIFTMSGIGAIGFGAAFMLALLPTLVWFGWTLHERSLYRNEQLEQRAMERLRKSENPDSVIAKRKKTANA